ncbi:MAG: hypothetical protein GF383_09970 [Candidatus Lokiarchaeota archaeon]|nr:hypothetical protein [Candidatus Lokiarchaeota archaeon]MBD3340861.1 hypothetical protein [Candidatus Lokiarchaeota archaeon]
MIVFETEQIDLQDGEDGSKILMLPKLTEEEKRLVDPIVAPTSGLRIQIYDIIEENKYLLTKRKLFLFLRVFKAISEKFKEMHPNSDLKILIVTDDRPSRNVLLRFCSQIFSYDGYQVYHQKEEKGESRVSSPYGAASIALYEDINLVIVLTASHNELSWNGVKFYIDYPIPISGNLFKEVSKKALNYEEIRLNQDYQSILTDAIQKNNDYVIKLLSKVVKIESLKDKNIVIWPYLGKAEGIVSLYRQLGANVILVDEQINPPNPIKKIKEEKLKEIMNSNNSNLALLLDADRDRIALYVRQNGKFFTYIPNEIYSAMHKILAEEFNKKIINVRTIPSDLRGDEASFLNVLTGVGYKHLGIILYFLFGIEVDQSKIDSAILYMEEEDKTLIKIKEPIPLRTKIIDLVNNRSLDEKEFIVVMWEESGGHTLNVLKLKNNNSPQDYQFLTNLPLIADKYPVPALVIISELICRNYVISESIDWSIVGINRTIHAEDEEKVKLMNNFKENDGKTITINEKKYEVRALSDNSGNIDIYQLKSDDSTLYFRPSGTGPDVRFYIFGNRDTYSEEIENLQEYVKQNYL